MGKGIKSGIKVVRKQNRRGRDKWDKYINGELWVFSKQGVNLFFVRSESINEILENTGAFFKQSAKVFLIILQKKKKKNV